jgi:hypothetical protein
VNHELPKRGVAGGERLPHISRKNEREIFCAMIARFENLATTLKQVRTAKTDQGREDEDRRQADRQLALPHRRQPQMIAPQGTNRRQYIDANPTKPRVSG